MINLDYDSVYLITGSIIVPMVAGYIGSCLTEVEKIRDRVYMSIIFTVIVDLFVYGLVYAYNISQY